MVHSSRDQFAEFFHVHLIYSSLFLFFRRPQINLSKAFFYFLHSLRYEDAMLVSLTACPWLRFRPFHPRAGLRTGAHGLCCSEALRQHWTACSSGSGGSSNALLCYYREFGKFTKGSFSLLKTFLSIQKVTV